LHKGNIKINLAQSDNKYKFSIESLKDKPGRFRDVINITTDNKQKEKIDIPVYVNIQNNNKPKNNKSKK